MSQAALNLAVIPSAAEQRKLGEKLLAQYRRACDGMIEYIAFGALCQRAQALVDCARAANSATRGPGTKGTGLKAWLAEYAPDITERTAYRYIELAEGVRAEFGLGEKVDLYAVLKSETPEPKQVKLREQIGDFVAGKSQRQLLIGFGAYELAPATKKPAAKATEAELREAWVEEARTRSVTAFSGLHDVLQRQRWQVLDDDLLRQAVKDARAFAAEAERFLAKPKAERAELDVAALMAADAADAEHGS